MGDGRECKEGWFSSRRRELPRKASTLVSVLPRWAGPEWLRPAHQPGWTFPQLYVQWRHMASLKPAMMGELTAWKLANPALGPPLYEDPQIPESGESLQERPSGGNVGAPPKGEPRMCIQAGSEGSRTKKLSCRGQKRGTGMQEALGSLCFAGPRLQVSTDHGAGGSRQTEAGVGRARPRQGGHR